MNMSTAAARSNKPKDQENKEDGENLRSRPQVAESGADSDDGFEVVTDRKRTNKNQYSRDAEFWS